MSLDETESRIIDLISRTGISQGTMQTYRKRLSESGLVDTSKRGYLRFSFPQMAEYLRRERRS